jgi:hypothetical protein
MGLVARYFERLGDHAFNITRRLQHTHLGALPRRAERVEAPPELGAAEQRS